MRNRPGTLSALLALLGLPLLAGCTASTAAPATVPVAPVAAVAPAPVIDPEPDPEPDLPPPPERTKVRVESVTPGTGRYGIGMPITVTFTKPVPKRLRALVENAVQVSTSRPVTVAWSWTDTDTMTLRPQEFWPERTTVDVDADFTGTDPVPVPDRNEELKLTGGRDVTLTIAREQITRVNANTKQMTVYRNGKKLRTMPTSLGKPGFVTRSGIKVIHERYEAKRMTSQALGLTNETYDLIAPYALRLTPTGEFVHGAPWATGRLGRYNGSHGCTNLSVADAKWFYVHTLMGDPVITTGTSRQMEPWNGNGGPWNVKWKKWLAGSASGPFNAGPDLPDEPAPDTEPGTAASALLPPTPPPPVSSAG